MGFKKQEFSPPKREPESSEHGATPLQYHALPICSDIRLLDDPIVAIEGSVFLTKSGARLIDAMASACTAPFGNSPLYHRVAQAYADHILEKPNLSPYFTDPKTLTYAERLALLPEKLGLEQPTQDTVHSANATTYLASLGITGTDSIDAAVKMACAYTGKQGGSIFSFKGSYHGQSGYASRATAFCKSHPANGDVFLDFPVTEDQAQVVLETVASILAQRQDIAAFVYEFIQGDAGIKEAPAGFFYKLQKLCEQHNVLTVVDEIQSGLGRTGKMFSFQHEFEHKDTLPDLFVLGKGLAGGACPLSAIIGKREVINSLPKPHHVFSFSMNGAAAAAGLAVLDILFSERVPSLSGQQTVTLSERNSEVGVLITTQLQSLQREYPDFIRSVRGRGLMLGMEFASARTALIIQQLCIEQGVLFGLIGENNEVLRIEPHYTLETPLIDQMINGLATALEQLNTQQVPAFIEQKIQTVKGLGQNDLT